MTFLKNTLKVFSILVLCLSCSKENPSDEIIDPDNSDVISNNLIMPSGTQQSEGSPPPPSGSSEAPIATNQDPEIDAIAGSEFTLPVAFSNVANSITGIYLQIDGANSFYTIPVSSAKNEEIQISINIGVPNNIMNGQFCMSYCGFDENGQISNVITTCVNIVETLPEFPEGVYPNNLDTLEGDQLGLGLVPNERLHKEVDIELNISTEYLSFDKATIFRSGEYDSAVYYSGLEEFNLWEGVIVEITNISDVIVAYPFLEFYYLNKEGERTLSFPTDLTILGSTGINKYDVTSYAQIIQPGETILAIGYNPFFGLQNSDVESISITSIDHSCTEDCGGYVLSHNSVLPINYEIVTPPTFAGIGLGRNGGELKLTVNCESDINIEEEYIHMVYFDENNNPVFAEWDVGLKMESNLDYIMPNQTTTFKDDDFLGFFGSSTKALFFIQFEPYED